MCTIAPDAPGGGTTAPGVSVQALLPWAVGVPPHGEAEVRSHHGEIVQGMFYSSDGTLEHGLVTLPCPLFRTRARFRPTASGPLTVHPAGRGRARAGLRRLGVDSSWQFSPDTPPPEEVEWSPQ